MNSQFNFFNAIENAQKYSSENLLYLLDFIVHSMRLQEIYDDFAETKYNKREVKRLTKFLSQKIDPILERDYSIVYNNGSDETQSIMIDLEIFVRNIGLMMVPESEQIQRFMKAYQKDSKKISSISKKIIKKSQEIERQPLPQDKEEYLFMLDYCVNLIFIHKYLSKMKKPQYDVKTLKQMINKIINKLTPLIEKDKGILFEDKSVDLIKFYIGFIDFLGTSKIDQKIVLSQLIESWNYDKKSIEGIVSKILD